MEDAAPQPESRIFISYRREDSSGHVLALLPALRRRFGANRVFKDTDNIPPGEDFLKFIRHELESCSVLLAIIGREWLTVQDPRLKRRRLDNPDDFLRVEVGTALGRDGIRVIPVLVERASMPSVDELPPDLKALSHRNAVELSDVRWESDVQLLIAAIERSSATAAPPAPAPVRPEIVELQKRRAREIAGHLAAAGQALDSEDYDAALVACEKVLLLNPEQREALEFLDRARKAIDERKISTWLAQAQALLRKGEIGDSSDLIDQALAVDNTSEVALALRKEMLNYRREREREREKAKLVNVATDQAKTCLDDGDFEAAIRHADDALNVDPEATLARGIKARATAASEKRRAERELKRRAQQAGSDARAMAAAGDRANALRVLREFTPPHELIVQALTELQTELETVESRERRIADLTAQAAAAVTRREFDHAIALLAEASQLDPAHADVTARLEDARARQSADAAVQRTLIEGAASFERGDYHGARQIVEAAQAQDPGHPQILAWLARIAEALAEQAAVAARSEGARAAVAGARDSLAKGELTSALRHVDEALLLNPGLVEAQELSAEVRAALAQRRARDEQDRRANEAAEHARRLFDAEDHAGAIQVLERFTPAHARVSQALALLREELRAIEARRRQQEEEAERQRQELERATKARKRAEALRAILAKGETSLARQDHAGALWAADEVLRQDPESTAARELRARAVSLREGLEREERERRDQERHEQERREEERRADERRAHERREQRRREEERQQRERETRERERRAEEAAAARAAETSAADTGQDQPLPTSDVAVVSRGRRWVWQSAAAALLVVTLTTVWYYRQAPSPVPPASRAEPSAGADKRDVPAVPAEQTPPVQTPSAPPLQTPAPNASAEGSPPLTPAPAPPGNESPAVTEDERRRQQVDSFRATARNRYRTGQLVQALSAAVGGLALAPDDQELTSMVDALLGQAGRSARQAKARATTADAPTHAKEVWGQAVRAEEAGDRARDSNKGTAALSYWTAVDRYNAATRQATDARKIAAAPSNAAPQPPAGGAASRDTEAGGGTPSQPEDKKAPDRPSTPDKPPVSPATEESRIHAVLERYEEAYDKRDAGAVKNIYPSVRGDLAAIFAGYQYYKLDLAVEAIQLSPDGQRAVAKCRLFHAFQPNVNTRPVQRREDQDISLEKRGDTWVIVGLRKR